jgi:hypothetical protein
MGAANNPDLALGDIKDVLILEQELLLAQLNGVGAQIEKYEHYEDMPSWTDAYADLDWTVGGKPMPLSLTGVVAVFLNSIGEKWQVRFPKLKNMWSSGGHA